MRVLSMLIYIVGLVLAAIAQRCIKRDLRRAVILAEALALLLVGLFPIPGDHLVALYPLFLISSIQWSFFCGAGGYICSSVFCTNNLKQCTLSLVNYCFERKHMHLSRCFFYGMSLLCYFTGVAIAGFTDRLFHLQSIWACLPPLVVSFGIAAKLRGLEKKPQIETEDVSASTR